MSVLPHSVNLRCNVFLTASISSYKDSRRPWISFAAGKQTVGERAKTSFPHAGFWEESWLIAALRGDIDDVNGSLLCWDFRGSTSRGWSKRNFSCGFRMRKHLPCSQSDSAAAQQHAVKVIYRLWKYVRPHKNCMNVLHYSYKTV